MSPSSERESLTSEEMIRLANEAVLNQPPSIETPEALQYYAQVLKEIEPAMAAGMTPHLPYEV